MFLAGAAAVAAVAGAIAVNVLTGDPNGVLPAGLGWLHPQWRSWTAVGVLTGLSVVLAVLAARQDDDATASGSPSSSSPAAVSTAVGAVRGHGQFVVGATGTVTGPVHAPAGPVIQEAHHVTVYPPASDTAVVVRDVRDVTAG
jgi:hypothetical protein